MKKLIALFALIVYPLITFSENIDDGILRYNVISKTKEATVNGFVGDVSNRYIDSLIIPETITYNGETYSVTSIKEGTFEYARDCFWDCKTLIIGNNVTSIGDGAFKNFCAKLKSLKLSNKLVSIGKEAFNYTHKYAPYREKAEISKLSIPESLKAIGENAFGISIDTLCVPSIESWCNIQIEPNGRPTIFHFFIQETEIKDALVIPGSVTKIPDYCFQELPIKDLIIENGVKTIGYGAFIRNANLSSITLPASLDSIADYAFASNLDVLQSVNVPNIESWCNISFGGGHVFWHYKDGKDFGYDLYINGEIAKNVVLHRNGVIPASCRASRRSLK